MTSSIVSPPRLARPSFLLALLVFLQLFANPTAQGLVDCTNIDVCYVIDESTSVRDGEFSLIQSQIPAFTLSLNASTTSTRFSAVSYSWNPRVIHPLDSDFDSFFSSLQSNTQSFGASRPGIGMLACSDLLTNANYPRLVMLVSDGEDHYPPGNSQSAVRVSRRLENEALFVGAVAVGQRGDLSQRLRDVVSHPALFAVLDTMEPSTFAQAVQNVVMSLCEIATFPSPTPSASLSVPPTPSPSTTSTVTATPTSTSTMTSSPSMTPPVTSVPTLTATATATPSPAIPSLTASATASPSPMMSDCHTVSVCFAVDGSGSLTSAQFTNAVRSASTVAEGFAAMSMNSLFSGVFFSDHVDLQAVPGPVARLLFEFETYTQEGGLTSSGVGLLGCMRALQSSTSTLQKVIVLVTDDTLDTTMPEGSGSAVAASLKDDGVIIATLIAGAAPNVTLAYASSPSLSFHLTDSFYLANPRPIINGLCSVPMPARASPSPRISPSPRPLGIVIDDPFLIPIFSPSNTRHANAEAAAIGFQYYVARELSFKPMMRVTASLIRLDSPVFPWDVVMPHGSTGEATASPDPVGVDDWKRGGGARMCGGRFDDMCAAHVVITADRKIPRSKVRTAFKMLKRNHAGFLQVFMQTKGKFRIVETGLYEYSVFLPFVNEAITV